jgi:glycosyltransferase involved in cell wall biosynthesis
MHIWTSVATNVWSPDWSALALGWRRALALSPLGRLIALKGRAARAVEREGAAAFAARMAARSLDQVRQRVRIGFGTLRSWAPDDRPVFLLINHRCGGGTEQHVRDMSTELRAEGVRVVVVCPSRAGFLLWEEPDEGKRVSWCRESTVEPASIKRLLILLEPVHAHVHHVMGVPIELVDLLAEQGIPYDWTIHDYYTICPRVNLINGKRSYCGEPDEAGCNQCLARLGDDQGHPVKKSIESWRDGFGRRLGHARRVFAPSADVRDRIERYFPNLSVHLRPHPESLPELKSLAAVLAPGEPVRVAVVGTITAVKGSERLLACARDAVARKLPLEFHVIGSTDRDAVFSRIGNVRVSGRYRRQEVYERIAAARCQLAFLPSVCPESFMFTLSIVMASGLYTVCFDLGAQASRLRRWGWGRVLRLDTGPAAINDSLLATARELAAAPVVPSPPPPARHADVLGRYYGFSASERERLFLKPRPINHTSGAKAHAARRSAHAYIH